MYVRNHSKKKTKESRVKAEPVINVTRLPFYVILSNICECGAVWRVRAGVCLAP